VTREFDDLVDGSGLTPEERRRLEGVHELLVAAGPPPDLPAALREPPAPVDADVVSLDSRRPRRRTALVVIAAALALGCFGAGYALGDRGGSDGDVVRVMALEGSGPARASVSLGQGQGGNWPMELTVTGLPQQTTERGYYELFVWRNGKPGYPCVGFKMQQGTTTVRFTVPYELKDDTELVVTAIDAKTRWPGSVVMRTV
jgi:hypothetical protein